MTDRWKGLAEIAAADPYTLASLVVALVLTVFLLALWARRRRNRSPTRGVATAPATEAQAAARGRPSGRGVPAASQADVDNPYTRLVRGLAKTRDGLVVRLGPILRRDQLDDAARDELEAALLAADVGPGMTGRLLAGLGLRRNGESSLRDRLEQAIVTILEGASDVPAAADEGPRVIMVVGVNGVGKTTSIGKLAARYTSEGKRVLLVAADTFRAAAIEQLAVWAERAGAALVRAQHGSDPGAVVYDGMRAALARRVEVVIIDTAGRLHTKTNLMEELRKLRRVIGREITGAPHETLLVLDATTGQNGLAQARAFLDDIGATGVILTKLDGTAKGGVVIPIAGEMGIPIRYIGVGEGVDDLRAFEPRQFVAALFDAPGSTSLA